MGLVAEDIYGPEVEEQESTNVYEYNDSPENRSWVGALPVKQGLYDPENEKDAGGVGFAAYVGTNPESSMEANNLVTISRVWQATIPKHFVTSSTTLRIMVVISYLPLENIFLIVSWKGQRLANFSALKYLPTKIAKREKGTRIHKTGKIRWNSRDDRMVG